MSTSIILEMLEKLPFQRRRKVYDYIEFIYKKSQEVESEDDRLTQEEIKELEARRAAYLKDSSIGNRYSS